MIELEELDRKIERIRSDVKAILLYGSLARGKADSLSDVDLLIIVDDPSKAEKLNLGMNALITSEDALRRAVAEKPSIYAMLKEAIVLHGNEAISAAAEKERDDQVAERGFQGSRRA